MKKEKTSGDIALKVGRKEELKERYGIDFRRFWTLVKMLLQDKLKLSFKHNKKQTIIKIVSVVVAFVALTAISYGLYYIVEMLHLFSVLSYIPLSVPSFISFIIFILSFISLVLGLNKTLYYSQDNRIMITYPCNGNTIFYARLFVYFIYELLRNFTIQVPLLLGYMIAMSFPLYMVLWMIVGIVIITIFEILLASFISIPVYYITRFLNRYSIVKTIVYIVIFLAVVGLISYALYLIPDEIDIYTNWGPYFRAIQAFLNGYTTYLSPFYYLTQFLIGNLNGFSITPFSLTTLYVLLVLIGCILVLFVITLFVVNPIYFKLASDSFEYESDQVLVSKKNKKRSFFVSQLHKETLLFFKDSGYFASILFSFVFLPLMLTLLNKIFGAMNVNAFGDRIVACVNVLLILVASMSTNSVVASSYSSEEGAFELNRVYPRNNFVILLTKNLIPGAIGTISILASCVLFGILKDISAGRIALMFFAILFIYIGHMLFASQLDFCSITSNFSLVGNKNKSQRTIYITAFVIPIIVVVFFFLYLMDDSFFAYVKLFFVGLIIFLIFLWIYIRKVKLIYSEGK